ncbi:uncharacterized protein LOC134273196 [Saccostrea cucullata]|uniref:uncharacterized protein LOC134273196 n=1 Tax=Saccostrea cuccullata TaxID=36930 RepID=UPI002ED232DB
MAYAQSDKTPPTSPRSSAYDRRKQFDVCIMTCNDVDCHQPTVSSLVKSCRDAKLNFSHLTLTSIRCSEIQNGTAIATAVIVCKHSEKEFKDNFKSMQEGNVVLTGSIGKVKSSVFKNTISNVENEANMNRLFDKIKEVVLELSQYDDIRPENPYTEGIVDGHCQSSMETGEKELVSQPSTNEGYSTTTGHSSKFINSRSFDLKDYKTNRENTEIKTAYTETPVIKELTKEDEMGYTHLIDVKGESLRKCLMNRDKFIETTTLLSSGSYSGSFVFEEYILPNLKYDEKLELDELVHMFNVDSCKDSSDLERHIVTSVMRLCLECRNFHGLVILLRCQKRNIQLNAFRNIEHLLYTTDIRLCNTQDLINGITDLIEMIDLWSGNEELLLLLLHTVMVTFSILLMAFNASLNSTIKSPTERICKELLEKIKKIEKLHTDNEKMKGFFGHLQKSASCLSIHLKEVSVLRMGNWSDAMRNAKNRQKIRDDFKVFSETEQTTVIFGLMNLVIRQPEGNHASLFDLLDTCLKTTLKLKKKEKKDNFELFPKLYLITKMVYRILKVSPFQAQHCLSLLQLYMDTDRVHQSIRKYLLNEISSLLFHKEKQIVYEIFSMLIKNNSHSPFDLRQITVSHVEKLLHPLNISIEKDECVTNDNAPVPPNWCRFSGTINDNKDVNIQILLPSKNCIMKGIMEDYRENSVEKDIMRDHEKQRDMLHLLCREGMTSHVLPLVGFQCRPLPLFFVTQTSRDSMLLSDFLLQKRSIKDWLSIQKLSAMAADIISAVDFLHFKGIVHRGLTTSSFSINKEGQIIISGLVTASEGHSSEFVAECNLIPLRWSAPESILNDRFSTLSDVYMVGQVIYELFTHGCHPYTELYGYTLDDVLQLIIFQNLAPRQWPCIPREIHEIILKFVDPNPQARQPLKSGLQQLNNFLARSSSGSRKRLSNSHREDMKYPDLDPSQKEPQTEVPELIKQLKGRKENPMKTYANLRKTLRGPKTVLAITEADIASSDAPITHRKNQKLEVQEPISQRFYEVSFTELSKSPLQDILNILTWPPKVERKEPYNMHYRCDIGDTLSELSLRRFYGDPDDQNNNIKYTLIIHHLVQFICCLHDRGWLSRDICCRHLYYDHHKKKVFAPRLGRMTFLNPGEVLDDSVIDEVFTDRRNWYPLETLQHGQYSKEGDIYMLGMTIYEFYMGLEINLENPVSTSLSCVPFCRISKEELVGHILSGEVPQQPMYCPDDLFKMMLRCWNRDRTQRPTCTDLLEITTKLLSLYEDGVDDCFSDVIYEELDGPELPPRNLNPNDLSIHPSNPVPCVPETDNEQQFSKLGSEYKGFTKMIKPSCNTSVGKMEFQYSKENPIYMSTSNFDRADTKRSLAKQKINVRQQKKPSIKSSAASSEDTESIESCGNPRLDSILSWVNPSSSNLSSDSALSRTNPGSANLNSDSELSWANSSSSVNQSSDSALSCVNTSSSSDIPRTGSEGSLSTVCASGDDGSTEEEKTKLQQGGIIVNDYLAPIDSNELLNKRGVVKEIDASKTNFQDSSDDEYIDFDMFKDNREDYLNPFYPDSNNK